AKHQRHVEAGDDEEALHRKCGVHEFELDDWEMPQQHRHRQRQSDQSHVTLHPRGGAWTETGAVPRRLVAAARDLIECFRRTPPLAAWGRDADRTATRTQPVTAASFRT